MSDPKDTFYTECFNCHKPTPSEDFDVVDYKGYTMFACGVCRKEMAKEAASELSHQ